MTLPDKQQRALRALRSGLTTSVECAHELGITRDAADHALRALCAKALVQRAETRYANNRIQYLYTLTDEGRAWLGGPKPVGSRCPWFDLGADNRPSYNEIARKI